MTTPTPANPEAKAEPIKEVMSPHFHIGALHSMIDHAKLRMQQAAPDENGVRVGSALLIDQYRDLEAKMEELLDLRRKHANQGRTISHLQSRLEVFQRLGREVEDYGTKWIKCWACKRGMHIPSEVEGAGRPTICWRCAEKDKNNSLPKGDDNG